MSHRRSLAAVVFTCAAVVFALAGSACGSDDGPASSPAPGGATTPTDGAAAEPSSGDDAAPGGGIATLTVDGDEPVTFDSVVCGFGEEGIGVEGATWNMAARSGSLSLYATIEPGLTSIELADLDDPDAPNLMTTGEATIDLDGATARGTATFIDVNDSNGEERAGTLEVTCP